MSDEAAIIRKRLQFDLDQINDLTAQMPLHLKVKYGRTVTEALSALDALVASLEALRQTPSVHCVAYTSDGKPMDTVKLLGDREAVLAVQGLKRERDESVASLAAAREERDALEKELTNRKEVFKHAYDGLRESAVAAEAREETLRDALKQIAKTHRPGVSGEAMARVARAALANAEKTP